MLNICFNFHETKKYVLLLTFSLTGLRTLKNAKIEKENSEIAS